MKKYFSTAFAVLCLFTLVVCLGITLEDATGSAAVYSDVLRLHIVANSDSQRDQELKYLVRDEILPTVREMFCRCRTVDEALDTALVNRAFLEESARAVLRHNDSRQTARVLVGKAHYPSKHLCGIDFPEGEYLSVRLELGDADGKNWWCVLFPSLCDAGVSQEETAITQEGKVVKDDGGVELFGCRVKLKILEYFR